MLFRLPVAYSLAMAVRNPGATLGVVLLPSLVLFVALVVTIVPLLVAVDERGGGLQLALAQLALPLFLLFLVFLLPSSYVYWQYRIHVTVIGPQPGTAEPGDEISLTIATAFPGVMSSKGAILEASLGNLAVATEKLEASPTKLTLTVPDLPPGYYTLRIQVTRLGCFTGNGSYELLITPPSGSS
jgi:hypothetical protein